MPKYWGKQIITHGRFPEVGQKQKTERKKERLNDGNNNGQVFNFGLHQCHFTAKNYVLQNQMFKISCHSNSKFPHV